MKKFLIKIMFVTFLGSMVLFNGCDDLNKLPINVPIVVNFSTSGSNSTLTDGSSFCLSDYQDWRDNQSDINSANYVSAAYWTESASAGLQGDVTVTLSDQFGNMLFSITLDNYQASSNINTPYTLELNEAEIQALDAYLTAISENDNNLCFNSSVSISNISGTSPYQLTGRVEIVIEANVNL